MNDRQHMTRALELAALGEGLVEPNPLVGCVITLDDKVIGEGWHRKFGGPHAEIEALNSATAPVAGATMYVTLEPCCHTGKTPPCTEAIIAAGISRVVVALADPFPQVAGGGLAKLRAAAALVESGLCEAEARRQNAPYFKRVQQGRPWIIAKWAMTLDGKIAAPSGNSQWISSTASREIVHRLRGRVDAILVGSNTARLDDPLLTARPAGARTATRIVVDSNASLSPASRLLQTAGEIPVLVAVSELAPVENRRHLASLGAEVVVCPGSDHAERLSYLLQELGQRQMTNVLVEGGGQLLGSLFDLGEIDEVHAFIAPKLIGGGFSPLAGKGKLTMNAASILGEMQVEQIGPDLYVWGRVQSTND